MSDNGFVAFSINYESRENTQNIWLEKSSTGAPPLARVGPLPASLHLACLSEERWQAHVSRRVYPCFPALPTCPKSASFLNSSDENS